MKKSREVQVQEVLMYMSIMAYWPQSTMAVGKLHCFFKHIERSKTSQDPNRELVFYSGGEGIMYDIIYLLNNSSFIFIYH